VNLGFCPGYERLVLHENGEERTVRDEFGITFTEKKGRSAIPRYIGFPIKTRGDWEMIRREQLRPDSPGRFPGNWRETLSKLAENDYAIQIGGYPYGLFGTLRHLMGAERLLVSFYDDPELVHDIMDTLTDFWISVYTRVLQDIRIDHIHIWEDMSGKQGPLISPAMFREFMLPNYKKIVAFAGQNGIPVVSVDTDGNMDIMMPLLEESGINLVLPFEVQAGCDIVALKKKYPGVCMHGGIDKRELALGREAIDRELERVGGLFDRSGYIPTLDHHVPPDISYNDFTYFARRLKEKIFGTL